MGFFNDLKADIAQAYNELTEDTAEKELAESEARLREELAMLNEEDRREVEGESGLDPFLEAIINSEEAELMEAAEEVPSQEDSYTREEYVRDNNLEKIDDSVMSIDEILEGDLEKLTNEAENTDYDIPKDSVVDIIEDETDFESLSDILADEDITKSVIPADDDTDDTYETHENEAATQEKPDEEYDLETELRKALNVIADVSEEDITEATYIEEPEIVVEENAAFEESVAVENIEAVSEELYSQTAGMPETDEGVQMSELASEEEQYMNGEVLMASVVDVYEQAVESEELQSEELQTEELVMPVGDENIDREAVADAIEDIPETAAIIDNNIKDDYVMETEEVVRVATDETSIIARGLNIKGDVNSDGNIDLIGGVEGNVECLGKLNILGTVVGNSKANEIFVDAARVNGEICAAGTVKIGQSSVIIGNVIATSAVIAGAVKGDIDVKGPVILDASAIVMGNIKSKSVQINNGAVIDGNCSQCYADVNPVAFFENL